jgi:hypothetical protein
MPCNTIQTNTVNLEKCPNHDLLEKAITNEFGAVSRVGSSFVFRVGMDTVNLRDGRATSRMSEVELGKVVGRIKQSYSREVVKFACKRFGWATEKGLDANNFFIRKG